MIEEQLILELILTSHSEVNLVLNAKFDFNVFFLGFYVDS